MMKKEKEKKTSLEGQLLILDFVTKKLLIFFFRVSNIHEVNKTTTTATEKPHNQGYFNGNSELNQ